MSKSFFILIITLISCSSAVKTASVSKHVSDVDTQYVSKDSILFSITSYNLSEDLTQNDELLIMAYWMRDSLPLETAVIKKQVIIDPDHMSRDFTWPIPLASEGKNMLLFFIEQDSETPIPQIDAILRIHHTDLIDAFNRHSYSDIETYLGDEDLLSYKLIKEVNFSKPIQFSFSGRYKMDKYEYSIHIQKLKSTHNFK